MFISGFISYMKEKHMVNLPHSQMTLKAYEKMKITGAAKMIHKKLFMEVA